MRLRNAVSRFARTRVDGWTVAGGWVAGVALGSLLPFDRFITQRSFGQKKRIFMTSPNSGPIPEEYKAIRVPGKRVYLVSAHNEDLDALGVYGDIYLLHEAPFEMEIFALQSELSSAGVPKAAKRRPVYRLYGDMERVSGNSSEPFQSVDLTASLVTLPGGLQLHADLELKVGGQLYNITESWVEMNTTQARVTKRGSDAG